MPQFLTFTCEDCRIRRLCGLGVHYRAALPAQGLSQRGVAKILHGTPSRGVCAARIFIFAACAADHIFIRQSSQ